MSLDALGNPLALPAGLGDLPLHLDKDGWHSVLGSWNAPIDNTEPEAVNEKNSSNNSDIPIPPVNPPRNAHPDLPLIFCQYHKCSGNRLAIPLYPLLYLHQAHNTNRYRYCPVTAARTLAPQGDLPAPLRIALGPVSSRQNKPSTGTTELSTSVIVWIVRLRGVCILATAELSVLIIFLLTC